jgi:hypothetical protein
MPFPWNHFHILVYYIYATRSPWIFLICLSMAIVFSVEVEYSNCHVVSMYPSLVLLYLNISYLTISLKFAPSQRCVWRTTMWGWTPYFRYAILDRHGINRLLHYKEHNTNVDMEKWGRRVKRARVTRGSRNPRHVTEATAYSNPKSLWYFIRIYVVHTTFFIFKTLMSHLSYRNQWSWWYGTDERTERFKEFNVTSLGEKFLTVS